MKIVTNDYGCGTSSSILDYNLKNVIVVSPNNWKHLIGLNEDLFFVGHDFLLYMWDTEEKVNMWKSHKGLKLVWCFERIQAIKKEWYDKSFYSLNMLRKFCDEIYCCDEDDADNLGYKWLPQWGSKRFFDQRSMFVKKEKILFSGQAGHPEYKYRNDLLRNLNSDKDICRVFEITNTSRNLSWDGFIDNMLSYRTILNPIGTMRALNTRAYETIYSGRVLLQQKFGKYNRHENMLSNHDNVIFFNDYEDLKKIIEKRTFQSIKTNAEKAYQQNNIYARFKSIGVEIS